MEEGGRKQNIQVPLSAPFVQYKRLVTTSTPQGLFTFSVIHRSTLEQGPWFYPVLLHESCTALAPLRLPVCDSAKEGSAVDSGHVVALVLETRPSSG